MVAQEKLVQARAQVFKVIQDKYYGQGELEKPWRCNDRRADAEATSYFVECPLNCCQVLTLRVSR